MKKLFVTILLLLAAISYAGQKAITDKGEEVILNSDGTWEYSDSARKAANIIKTNKTEFKRPADSSFLLKSTTNNSAYWINTDKWFFEKGKSNPEAEYQFRLKGEDLYGMAITERAEIPLESLANIALINAKEKIPDIKIVEQEFRIVNGKKLIHMVLNGTYNGIKVIYSGYYYSDASGVTQLIAYTTTNLVDKYKPEMYDFLNGLTTH